MKQKHDEIIRYIAVIYGMVQGVGFRPFVYNLARGMGLKGYVSNSGGRVLIEIEGEAAVLNRFMEKLVEAPPLLAQIESISIDEAEPRHYSSFEIMHSGSENSELRFVPRDTAVCNSCLKDIFEQDSRWFGYAFTNCTNCGPRYSILQGLPYDRDNTTMKSFEMCPECKTAYETPEDRRFHAQPVCCPKCGPELQLLDKHGREVAVGNTIKEAARLLKEGRILAVKGLGGFHLMCDAQNREAVQSMRSRKRRPHRPLAVMAADMEAVERQCLLDEAARRLLQSHQAPIVLLDKGIECSLPDEIAPDTNKIGIMLPYSPLHFLLFAEGLKYLVATSGNISGQPIEYQNEKAISTLKGVVDYFLVHNRDIYIPIDDSVARICKGKTIVSRIGRGYAPVSINIGAKKQLMALGAEQKSSVSISQRGHVHTSQYLGDLKSPEAYVNYKQALDNLIHLMKIEPQAYVHDLHPYYLSTRYASEQKEPKLAIQHHFAHMAGCVAEHSLMRPVIGVVYDGTGLGEDGKNWGGEIFAGTLARYTRAGHLKYCSIQGGDKAVEEPWRIAVSYLHGMGNDMLEQYGFMKDAAQTVRSALNTGLNCLESSSMGRLFDCISALLGLCSKITYDAQAAIILENIADLSVKACYEYEILKEQECVLIDYEEIIKGILLDRRNGKSASEISGKFHNTIAAATADCVIRIGAAQDIQDVVLSGGCFENQLLMGLITNRLEKEGFQVYFNEKQPCNDGGISFGQLAAADAMLSR